MKGKLLTKFCKPLLWLHLTKVTSEGSNGIALVMLCPSIAWSKDIWNSYLYGASQRGHTCNPHLLSRLRVLLHFRATTWWLIHSTVIGTPTDTSKRQTHRHQSIVLLEREHVIKLLEGQSPVTVCRKVNEAAKSSFPLCILWGLWPSRQKCISPPFIISFILPQSYS